MDKNLLAEFTTSELIAEITRRRDLLTDTLIEFNSVSIHGTIDRIVAEEYRIPISFLHSDDATCRATVPRQVVMTLLRESGMSWKDAGDHFGKHHTTAMYAAKNVYSQEAVYPKFKAGMDRLRESLRLAIT